MTGYSSVEDYIMFLRREKGLSVTLHPKGVFANTVLTRFNIHDNPYCLYIKTCDEAWRHCIERQNKVNEKSVGGAFCGTCFAGVKEYVYPITDGSSHFGFISVSGYRTDEPSSYIQSVSEKYALPRDALENAYRSLGELPPKKEIDTLVYPLCAMLELLLRDGAGVPKEAEELYERLLRYVIRYHTRAVSVDELCHVFSCSRSYVSRLFKKRTGHSIPGYIAFLRIADAKTMLESTRLSVTEIALAVGYTNPNYFSDVFRKLTAMSPRNYRKRFGKM